MRNLEAIDQELAAAREELGKVEGTPTEVYSRIVGYYRSVRNWNKGKREEYGERKLFVVKPEDSITRLASVGQSCGCFPANATDSAEAAVNAQEGTKLLLFVRASCPACPGAKEAASRLGLPVELVDTDAAVGLSLAERHQVMSTPTAILFSADGRELARARDAKAISAFKAQEELALAL